MRRRPAADLDIRLTGVVKHYGDVVAVDGVDLEVRRGEFFSLLGPSGSGKTTTLRMIAGLELPDRGLVELGGQDITRTPPYARDVNTVFQDYALFPHMTVLENVEYELRVKGVGRAERRARAEQSVELVRLPGYGGRKPVHADADPGDRRAAAEARHGRAQAALGSRQRPG